VELRASSIASLSPSKRQAFLDSLDEGELLALEHDWHFWARDDQLAPPGLWRIWLALAGRGWGKTRVGAEWCHERAQASPCRIAIVAANKEDAEKVCVLGDSGIMATGKPWFPPHFAPAKSGGQVSWPNGSIAELYSGDNPQSLRGPQFHAAWCDELLKWRRMQAAWDMLRFGLRLGTDPRTVITSTPTPAKLLKELVKDTRIARDGLPLVRVTRGSTYANAANLAQDFLDELKVKYEGTRLGRQELYAEILEDKPGALWTLLRLEEHRKPEHPDLRRVVVAIDPPITSGEDADECGIIVAGVGVDGHGYVLDDASERGLSPKQWAEKALGRYVVHKADCIVAEANQGGEMITQVIRDLDANVPIKLVYASRGKVTRAEPVSNLYEQGRVHHVGVFKALEDQMCLAAGTLVETARGQVPIERVVAGDLVMTRAGYRSVEIACKTGCSSEFVVIETTDGRTIKCTQTHPIFNRTTQQFVAAASVEAGMLLAASPNWVGTAGRLLGGVAGTAECREATTATARLASCIARFGRRTAARYHRAITSTIGTAIQATTRSAICAWLRRLSTMPSMSHEAFALSAESGEVSGPRRTGPPENGTSSRASIVGRRVARLTNRDANIATTIASASSSRSRRSAMYRARFAGAPSEPETHGASIAVRRVTTLRTTAESVFNLKVEGLPEFYANGILTHNCDFTTDFDRKTAGYSPDRVDALVWAITELMLTAQVSRARGASTW
jgi:phage terminase large subunit-like protein